MFDNVLFVAQMNELGIKATEMAERCGVSVPMISSIAKGYKQPSFALAVRIAKIFNCSLDELVKGEEI